MEVKKFEKLIKESNVKPKLFMGVAKIRELNKYLNNYKNSKTLYEFKKCYSTESFVEKIFKIKKSDLNHLIEKYQQLSSELISLLYFLKWLIFKKYKLTKVYKSEKPDFIIVVENEKVIGLEITRFSDRSIYLFNTLNKSEWKKQDNLKYKTAIFNNYENTEERQYQKNKKSLKKHFLTFGDVKNNVKKFSNSKHLKYLTSYILIDMSSGSTEISRVIKEISSVFNELQNKNDIKKTLFLIQYQIVKNSDELECFVWDIFTYSELVFKKYINQKLLIKKATKT